MRAPVPASIISTPAIPASDIAVHARRRARPPGRARLGLAAVFALLALMLFATLREAEAQSRSFSFGGMGRSSGFGNRAPAMGRSPSMGSPAPAMVNRGMRPQMNRMVAPGMQAGRTGASRMAGPGMQAGRTGAARMATGGRVSRVGRLPATRVTRPTRPTKVGTRYPDRRPGKQAATGGGGCGPRAASSGGCKPPGTDNPPNRPPEGGNPGHYRAGSYGGGHYRAGSYGGGHQRAGSLGHRRFGSYGGIPPFSPPVPPPIVVADPPPPSAPPPGAGSPPPRGPQSARTAWGYGPPPAGEQRYVPDQVICVLRDDLSEQQINQFLARNRMARTPGGDLRMGLVGARVFRFRITDGRSVPAVIAALQNDPWGVSVQPNYLYALSQMTIPHPSQAAPRYRTATGGTRTAPGAYQSMQYVVAKLQLARAHAVSKGERVLIAVVDSGVDTQHPELSAGIVEDINVTDDRDQTPHMHGTAMTGAIISQAQLLGIAPAARVIAIRAFAPRSKTGASGTSFHIAAAIDRAVQEGARIVNLSLAGPHDPYVQKAIEEAYARGVILVAAAGNNGPGAPAAYPAAYPQVIAVTATDANDQPYARANRGRYVAVSAPGVDVLVAAPGGAYGTTTGTSVAAAHITGVIALMLARNPMLDPVAVRELLLKIARDLGPDGPDEQFGSGLADAYAAIMAAGPPQPSMPVAGGAPATQ